MSLFLRKQLNPNDYSPLALAYLGDCVYDLFVRARLLEEGNRLVTQLHTEAVGSVNAKAQSEAAHFIEDMLTENEVRVLKWGRNAKSNTTPKHASVTDYRWATGLETLIGYLYMDNQIERLCEILEAAYKIRRDDTK
ncbi:MAG: ribonuclease III domain-containing protein [Clostridia bacterium]|nr:ribonuclease III domain-containing protein [Clostridia bacterium]